MKLGEQAEKERERERVGRRGEEEEGRTAETRSEILSAARASVRVRVCGATPQAVAQPVLPVHSGKCCFRRRGT